MKLENKEIEIDKNTIVHKIQHSFIINKDGKEIEKKGDTEYIIIDKNGEKDPQYIKIS